jgi:spermidine synthase
VRTITLVDLDPAMTSLFRDSPSLRALNADALRSPKLHIVTADAFVWLMKAQGRYDAIIVDFPDPSNYSIGKLYSLTFYRRLSQLLDPAGYLVIQSTSPYVARQAYWCVLHTVEAAGLVATAYHAFVPSFGEWGYIAAGHRPYAPPTRLPEGLRFLDAASLAQMFSFAPDMQAVETEVNRLDNQALVRYFESEWGHYLAE